MKNRLKPFIFFFIISVLAVSAGVYIYYEQSARIKSEIYSQLTYISNIKRSQISNWIYDRENDGYISSQNKLLIKDVDTWIKNSQDKLLTQRILGWFTGIKNNPNYLNAYLISPDMQVKLSFHSDNYFDQIDKKYLKQALITGKPVVADLHKSENNGHVHFGFVTPLILETDTAKKIIALVLLVIDPDKTLFPLILSWPTQTKTAETLICRIDGDSVLFLNELRHKKNTALKLRVSLNDTLVPAVRAVRGYKGIFEGSDYRGVPVLSHLSKIDGSNWFMVTKMDTEEVLDPLYRSSLLILALVIIFISTSGITIAFFWKKQESKYFEEKYALQKSAEESAIRALNEKGVLLRELNHRTKNNMQIISSLIGLKASSLQNETHIAALNEIKYKIHAISLVHEKLQQSEDLSIINLKEYLSDLAFIISKGLSDDQEKIEMILLMEDINVNIDTAISCGLIANELISNAIKYAFPNNEKGFIKLELKQRPDGKILLRISDNGVGFKEDSFEDKLGLKLCMTIAEDQLTANVDINKTEGVCYSISFRNVV